MNNYIEYMNNISVDADLHEKIIKKATQKSKPLKRNFTLFRYAGIAACALILIACVWIVPVLLKPEPFYVGLPVENFSLAELHNPNGAEADSILFFRVSDFFSYNTSHIAFVRVIGTEQATVQNRPRRTDEIQTSTLQILSTVWSKNAELPETISVMQYKYGGCCADEPTNLLRKGGVYLLPLAYWENDGTWYINGTHAVLFEVDDTGRVWSHSPFEDFSSFDGKDASELVKVITKMTSDKNFPAAAAKQQ